MIRRAVALPPLLAAAIVAFGAFGALPAGASPRSAGAAAVRGQSPTRLARVRSHHRPRVHQRRPPLTGILLVAPADQAAALALALVAAPIAACPNADLIPGPDNLPAIAAATLCLVNQARARYGIDPLVDDAKLDQSARQHNADMIDGNDFVAGGLRHRVGAAGYLPSIGTAYSLGENIAFGVLERATPRAIVDGWDSVAGYLANILDPTFRAFGIAVDATAPAMLAAGPGAATYTLDFGSA
jgi:uncharacterized protein YkwD